MFKPAVISAMCFAAAFSASGVERQDSLHGTLKEVVVTADGAQHNLKAPEMGHHSLDAKQIYQLPVMLGEPDLVKSIQSLPGVSQGVEGFTGLYVHGGDNDQNLFLYEELPLYHVSHLGGIFSSFNVAAVDRLDFFKAAFPAKYGGRISSITDVKMRKPDFKKYTGRFSLGLLSGNAYISGPICKERTSFSFALRRSWVDLLSLPTLAIINATKKKQGLKHIAAYNFMDINARVDHRFNSSLISSVVGYYGHDYMKIGERSFDGSDSNNSTHFFDEDKNQLSWGNWGVAASLLWINDNNRLTGTAYYTNYHSSYWQDHDYQSDLPDPSTMGYVHNRTENGIKDFGVKVDYSAAFGSVYHMLAGAGYVNHNYIPENLINEGLDNGVKTADNRKSVIFANEVYAYVDNNLRFGEAAELSVGIRASNSHIDGVNHLTLEPRAAVRLNVTDDYSVKFCYSRMAQLVQQVSNNYVNLPTDMWQPITSKFKPLTSDQLSVGFYGNLPLSMYFSVEGWYKKMKNLLEYREGISSLNAALPWQDKLTAGKGWAYGVDISVAKEIGQITGSIGYGLMWNWRKFDELNKGLKFPAKFDNRHKVNININYCLNKKWEFNAVWTYLTGNRLTLSLYNYDIPGAVFPDAPHTGENSSFSDWNQLTGLGYTPRRNNIRMPAYHRLDISAALHVKTKKGRMSTWNFGLYNAYCHMNAMTIKKDSEIYENGSLRRGFRTLSLLPIIPSISYTYEF